MARLKLSKRDARRIVEAGTETKTSTRQTVKKPIRGRKIEKEKESLFLGVVYSVSDIVGEYSIPYATVACDYGIITVYFSDDNQISAADVNVGDFVRCEKKGSVWILTNVLFTMGTTSRKFLTSLKMTTINLLVDVYVTWVASDNLPNGGSNAVNFPYVTETQNADGTTTKRYYVGTGIPVPNGLGTGTYVFCTVSTYRTLDVATGGLSDASALLTAKLCRYLL